MPECSITSCDRSAHARGWCDTHYGRWRRTGDPLNVTVRRAPHGSTPAERLAFGSERQGECLIYAPHWKLNDFGYRRVRLSDGRFVGAHVLAWELANGRRVPPNLLVCHQCDTPACIEPAHLFLGTHRDNSDDRERKGRGITVRGSKSACHTLTEHAVQQVRTALLAGEPTREVARRFQVHPETIGSAATGRTWSHVTEPPLLRFDGRGRAGHWRLSA